MFPDGDPFFREIQDVYDEINEGMPPGSGFPRPDELTDSTAEIEASGLAARPDGRLRRHWGAMLHVARKV